MEVPEKPKLEPISGKFCTNQLNEGVEILDGIKKQEHFLTAKRKRARTWLLAVAHGRRILKYDN